MTRILAVWLVALAMLVATQAVFIKSPTWAQLERRLFGLEPLPDFYIRSEMSRDLNRLRVVVANQSDSQRASLLGEIDQLLAMATLDLAGLCTNEHFVRLEAMTEAYAVESPNVAQFLRLVAMQNLISQCHADLKAAIGRAKLTMRRREPEKFRLVSGLLTGFTPLLKGAVEGNSVRVTRDAVLAAAREYQGDQQGVTQVRDVCQDSRVQLDAVSDALRPMEGYPGHIRAIKSEDVAWLKLAQSCAYITEASD